MRKLIAAVLLTAALLLPAGVAAADESAPAGTNPCPAGSKGRIVWYYDPVDKQTYYYKLCIYTGP